ncbi:MAG: ABC transporter permease [Chloroflexota bacterium]
MLKLLPAQLLHVSRQFLMELPGPLKLFRRRKLPSISFPLLLGGAIVSFVLMFVLVLPFFVVIDSETVRGGIRLAPPDAVNWFGTDALGRDFFSRVVEGVRFSVWISFVSTFFTAIPGILLGLWSGYYEGWLDHLLSRLVEIFLGLPALLLAIVLIARFGTSLHVLIMTLMISGIPTFYRITRNETLSMKKQLFVEAGRSIGLKNSALIFRYIFLNIYPSLLTLFSIRMSNIVLMVSGLGFIGLGVQPPRAELGALLASGRDYYHTAWWLYIIPSCFILLIVLGFNLLGEGLRDWLDRFSHSIRR